MTALVGFQVNDYPILIGDLLVSVRGTASQPMRIPTVKGDPNRVLPRGSEFSPSKLKQKLNHVCDNLMIGGAGNGLAIRHVVKDLWKKSKTEPFTFNSLSSYFESLDAWIRNSNASFIGLISEPEDIAHSFGYKCETFSSERFGVVRLAGSACEDIKHYLKSTYIPPVVRKGQPNRLQTAITFSLMLTSHFLQHEIATYESLKNSYGGGYEIASYENGKLQKIDDIMYAFWYAEIDGDEVFISTPQQVFKYCYADDVLVIRAVGIEQNSIEDHSWFAVSPVYRDISEEESKNFKMPELASKWLCNYFAIQHHELGHRLMCRVHYRPDPESLIRFIEEEIGLAIAVEDDFLKETALSIHQGFMDSVNNA